MWDRSLLADPKYLESKGIGKKEHPRYIFNRVELPRLRALLKDQPDLMKSVRQAADAAMQSSWWQDFPEDDDTGWKGGPYDHVAEGLPKVALAYLITGEEKYLAAKEKFLKMARWWEKEGRPGATSPEGAGSGSRGINGRCANALAAGYDWTYNGWSDEERAVIRGGLEWRISEQERISGCSQSQCRLHKSYPIGPGDALGLRKQLLVAIGHGNVLDLRPQVARQSGQRSLCSRRQGSSVASTSIRVN